ncbi:hypothetical protein H5300_26155 [Vibrio sp. SG41-7]|uniref:hypothetical protein n=1 Tax=Vibrio sp. SG41-7 TaxID=2760973 RepID=UPI0015FFCCFB|nr:hypothetical protein [Vibrio sp. SG41-7]MBB1466667.1 hypothetical protein [Vibrio sp. SG41-7]
MEQETYKKSAVFLAISLSLTLTACDSDSDTDIASPRTLTLKIDTPSEETELEGYEITSSSSSRALSEEYDYSYAITNYGYIHVLREDGYNITITDDNGEVTYSDENISDGGNFLFSVTGEATVSITHPDLVNLAEKESPITTPYYTVSTEEPVSIPADADTVSITLHNTQYSLVTMQSEDVVAGTSAVNGRAANLVSPETAASDFLYSYQYVTQGISEASATDSQTGEIVAVEGETGVNRQYALTYSYTTPTDNNTGSGGIIIEDEWEDEIEIEVNGGGGVIAYDNILGATDLWTNVNTNAVSGKADGQHIWIYEDDVGDGSAKVKNSNFAFEVTFPDQAYVKLYLRGETTTDKVTVTILNDGSVRVDGTEDQYDTYTDFKNSDYGEYNIRNDYRDTYQKGTELTSVVGNFFLRLGDSTYEGFDEFELTQWNIQGFISPGPTPVINVDQIVGSELTQVNGDGSITGITAESHATRIYIPVDGNKVLAGYDFDAEVEYTPADEKPASYGYINIYLEKEAEDDVRLDYYPGTNEYRVEGQGSSLNWADVNNTYGDWTVREFTDSASPAAGGTIRGNFIWRSAQSSTVGNRDVFTVKAYNVVYSEPEPDSEPDVIPVIDPDNITGAENLVINQDGSVTGDISRNLATAYCDVSGDLPLNDYTMTIDVTPTHTYDGNLGYATGYTNVYLKGSYTNGETVYENTTYRINIERDGNGTESYAIYYDINTLGSSWEYFSGASSWNDILTDHGEKIVINWDESGMKGNFLTRFKKTDSNFTINAHTCSTAP